MAKGIKEGARAHELEHVSLSARIHQHVRIAIETAVHEELSDQVAQDRRLAENRRCAQPTHGGRGVTAASLVGLAIPPSLLLRADQVIE
jgi:hypothetical protein